MMAQNTDSFQMEKFNKQTDPVMGTTMTISRPQFLARAVGICHTINALNLDPIVEWKRD
jgi:hypothetical protein